MSTHTDNFTEKRRGIREITHYTPYFRGVAVAFSGIVQSLTHASNSPLTVGGWTVTLETYFRNLAQASIRKQPQ